jgi:hypothetical protein
MFQQLIRKPAYFWESFWEKGGFKYYVNCKPLIEMVGRVGIEPTTIGLKVRCSTI